MSSCKGHNGDKENHFSCSCSDRKRETTNLKCCWELDRPYEERAVFASPGQCKLVASGIIKYECSTDDKDGVIKVKFRRGGVHGKVVAEYKVDEGSCLTFVASNFNTITVEAIHSKYPSCVGHSQTNEEMEEYHSYCRRHFTPVQGEICITPHYQFPCG